MKLIGRVMTPPPAMEVGVEYEAGEYWMSKPVYKKLLRADDVPGGTTTQIAIGTDNIEHVFVDLSSSWVGYEIDPGTNYATDSTYAPSLYVEGGEVMIMPAAPLEGVTVLVAVKYTKTTD